MHKNSCYKSEKRRISSIHSTNKQILLENKLLSIMTNEN